jgi:hypothetical protein
MPPKRSPGRVQNGQGKNKSRETLMRNTKLQVLSTVSAIIRKHKNNYCVASQEKIIELLETWYWTKIKRRMLNYHLADLRKFGLIKSIHRTHRNSDGTICLMTSATCLTSLGYRELWALGCEWAKKKMDALIRKYNPKIGDDIKTTPAPPQSETDRRREMIPGMFADPKFRAAFGMDG